MFYSWFHVPFLNNYRSVSQIATAGLIRNGHGSVCKIITSPINLTTGVHGTYVTLKTISCHTFWGFDVAASGDRGEGGGGDEIVAAFSSHDIT